MILYFSVRGNNTNYFSSEILNRHLILQRLDSVLICLRACKEITLWIQRDYITLISLKTQKKSWLLDAISSATRGRVCGTGRRFPFKLFFHIHGKISASSRCFFARDERFATAILRNHATSSCTRVKTSVLVNVKL